jgi:hypothetical protein
MPENKEISTDIAEANDQPRAVLVRFAPEIAAHIDADARQREVSATEMVRSIVSEYYSEAGPRAELIQGIRDLIEDRFRHTVYEISRTRSSLYYMVERSEALELDRPKLEEIQRLSRQSATDYIGRLDGEIERRKNGSKANS